MAILTRPDGSEIFYKVVGKDTGSLPLVMIHGWCSRHEIWEHQVRHFRKNHRILLLDRRGHGRSFHQWKRTRRGRPRRRHRCG